MQTLLTKACANINIGNSHMLSSLEACKILQPVKQAAAKTKAETQYS